MSVIIGSIVVLAAVVVGMASVLGNAGPAHVDRRLRCVRL